MPKPEKHIVICLNTRPEGHPRGSCGGVGASDVMNKFSQEFMEKNLFDKAILTGASCFGPCCKYGPSMVVYPDGTWYGNVKPEDVPEIIEKHIIGGEPVERLFLPEEAWG